MSERARSFHDLAEPVRDATRPDGVVGVVRDRVRADKALGVAAIDRAGHELRTFQAFAFPSDITGRPDINKDYARLKTEQHRGLSAVHRKPFYRRIDVEVYLDETPERWQILVSEARGTAGVVKGNGWMLVSFSSTLGTQLEGKRPGSRVTIRVNKRPGLDYDVGESAKYESLLPEFRNAAFLLESGEFAFAAEADLDARATAAVESPPPPPPAMLPPVEYVAKATFGLGDIIVLRDDPQIGAMGLPFAESVVIEGPPGSGKTSIGIMRLAAMYDRQWDELGLDRARDRPFHDYATMRVLVYNDEMVEYLKGLAQSIGVEHVQVNTTHEYFRQICRRTKLLSGTPRRDKPSLAAMKGRREALAAFFAGFQAHAVEEWRGRAAHVRRALFALGPDFLTLADRLNDWADRVGRARVEGEQIVGSIGLADAMTDAATSIRQENSPTRRARSAAGDVAPPEEILPKRPLDEATLARRLPDARQIVEEAIREACGRADAARAMFDRPEYAALHATLEAAGVAAKTIVAADRLWRRQYAGALPAYSELDLAMSAWLGAKLLLSVNATRKPWIGGQLDPLTHVVVDEVQDLSPSHLAVLASQLSRGGTMTLVGDIHQNLNPHAGLRDWADVGLRDVRRTAFGVNYRQTAQLGAFLRRLHDGLYAEPCAWEPSPKLTGRAPRVDVARSWDAIARAVSREALYWRNAIEGGAGATVAVLYDGRLTPARLAWLRKRVATSLQDELIPVDVAEPGGGGEALRRTDRVVIASVRQTKGLEFDAVIFIEPKARWAKPVGEVDLRVRNGFYVATSRARAGLSVCMSNLPDCVEGMIADGLCERVDPAQA